MGGLSRSSSPSARRCTWSRRTSTCQSSAFARLSTSPACAMAPAANEVGTALLGAAQSAHAKVMLFLSALLLHLVLSCHSIACSISLYCLNVAFRANAPADVANIGCDGCSGAGGAEEARGGGWHRAGASTRSVHGGHFPAGATPPPPLCSTFGTLTRRLCFGGKRQPRTACAELPSCLQKWTSVRLDPQTQGCRRSRSTAHISGVSQCSRTVCL